jgi:hypothetical protein
LRDFFPATSFSGFVAERDPPFEPPFAPASAASVVGSAVWRFMNNWIATPTTLLTIQYNTNPLGAEKKKKYVSIIGISQVIITRCIFIDGSAEGGCGVSIVEAIIVTHMMIGNSL